MNKIPVTVLTGYLGAGKTTLLNRILSEPHGQKYAVIVNEFGEIGIDNDLVVGADEEIFEMNNGCICCTVRGDLIRIISGLMKRVQDFDGILIETTGLADPGPVAQTFFVDQDVVARAKLDSIVTVVDARHFPQRLKDTKEAQEQIAFADVIILNKTDLVSADELKQVEKLIKSINAFAKIVPAQRCQVEMKEVLGLGGFDLERILQHESDFLTVDHSHDHSDHEHDATVKSFSLTADRPLDPTKFENWMSELRSTKGEDMLRYKGILDMAGSEKRLAIQGVHMMMDGHNLSPWMPGASRRSRLVFIGRKLDEQELRRGFESCMVPKMAAAG